MSLRELAANAPPFSDLCTDEECLGCGRVSSHSQEGAGTLLLLVLAPELALLVSEMAGALEHGYWDQTTDKWRCQDCEMQDGHGPRCEIGILLERFRQLENSAVL